MEGSTWGSRRRSFANDMGHVKPSSAPRTQLRGAKEAAVGKTASPRGTPVQQSRLNKQRTGKTGMQFTS